MLPWMRFYTRDWLDNKELRRCSPAARAVLSDLMCLAHEGVPYGHLADKVGPLTVGYMASRCMVKASQLVKLIGELVINQRLQQKDGVYFVPRLVQDETDRLKSIESGSTSKGNPKLSTLYNAPGFVYLISRSSDGSIKIGIAKDVQNRIYKLRSANRPDHLEVVDVFEVSDMGKAEASLHSTFENKKVVGEWFSLDASDIGTIRSSFKGSTPVDSRAGVRAGAGSDSLLGFDSKKEVIPFVQPKRGATPPDPVLPRFAEWISPWMRVADEQSAMRMWMSTVTTETVSAAFACRDRYLASEEVARGVVMEPWKFLRQQADNSWSGKWPSASEVQARASPPVKSQYVRDNVSAEELAEYGG